MRHATIAVIIASALVLPLQIGISPFGMDTSKAAADSRSTSSHFHGFSGTYPILSPKELLELNRRTAAITEDLATLKAEIGRLSHVRDSLVAADTISIRKHVTLLGGLVRIPPLTRQEKRRLKMKQELEAENNEAAEQLCRAEMRVAALKKEQQDLMDLMERHA